MMFTIFSDDAAPPPKAKEKDEQKAKDKANDKERAKVAPVDKDKIAWAVVKARYISDGNVLDYVAPSNIRSGQLVIMAELAGIALTDIKKGTVGAVQIYGIWELPKASGEVSVGAKLYWNATNFSLTTDATDNVYLGIAIEAASSDAELVKLLLPHRGKDV